VRFPSPPRAIESFIARARRNARATAFQFKSLKKFILGKVDHTLKKLTRMPG
jgi:hypothetical protein